MGRFETASGKARRPRFALRTLAAHPVPSRPRREVHDAAARIVQVELVLGRAELQPEALRWTVTRPEDHLEPAVPEMQAGDVRAKPVGQPQVEPAARQHARGKRRRGEVRSDRALELDWVVRVVLREQVTVTDARGVDHAVTVIPVVVAGDGEVQVVGAPDQGAEGAVAQRDSAMGARQREQQLERRRWVHDPRLPESSWASRRSVLSARAPTAAGRETPPPTGSASISRKRPEPRRVVGRAVIRPDHEPGRRRFGGHG